MSTVELRQETLTIEQRENNLKKLDAVAGNVVSLATGVGGLNELGIWAGGVKATEVVHAVVYSVPAFVLAIAVALALASKVIQWWDLNPKTYASVFAQKRLLSRAAIGLAVAGVVLFFLAILLYMAREL